MSLRTYRQGVKKAGQLVGEWVLENLAGWIKARPSILFAIISGLFIFSVAYYILPGDHNQAVQAFFTALLAMIFALCGWVFREYLANRTARTQAQKNTINICGSLASEILSLQKLSEKTQDATDACALEKTTGAASSCALDFVFAFTPHQDYFTIYHAYASSIHILNPRCRESIIRAYSYAKAYMDAGVELTALRHKAALVNEEFVSLSTEHSHGAYIKLRLDDINKNLELYSRKEAELKTALGEAFQKALILLEEQKQEAERVLRETPALF